MATATPDQDGAPAKPVDPSTQPASKPEGPTGEFTGSIKVSQKAPSKSDLAKVAELPLLNSKNESIPFKSLYTSSTNPETRILIIFIRHFFCGVSVLSSFPTLPSTHLNLDQQLPVS